MHTEFSSGNLKGRLYSGNLGMGQRIIQNLKERGVTMWNRFIWLGTRSCGRVLWTW